MIISLCPKKAKQQKRATKLYVVYICGSSVSSIDLRQLQSWTQKASYCCLAQNVKNNAQEYSIHFRVVLELAARTKRRAHG